jgi:pimeloyl-ACP methyl ester carboxylesterase
MNIRLNFLKAQAVFILVTTVSVFGQPAPKSQLDAAVMAIGKGFVSGTAKVNGTTLYYVRGGTGPSVILLHGFPEDWFEFRELMPRLAKKFTVIAVDLRGIGGSAPSPVGFDAANMAEDIHQLAQQLKLERIYVAGHDIGGMVAYAFARTYPEATRGVMVLDVPLPGIDPWKVVIGDPMSWHIGFHQMPSLPEKMIAGRQAIYFREGFFNRGTLNHKAVTEADAAHFVDAYATIEQLRAGLEFFRAFPANEKFNAAPQSASAVPIVLVGADRSFGKLNPQFAQSLRACGCTKVTVEVIVNSGHYLVDEQPEAVAKLIEDYASRD